MKQRIRVGENISFEMLQKEIEIGGEFIIFPYCVSIFVKTLRLLSPAIFIRKGESIRNYQKQYNIYSLIFGWWGIPWGPIYTVKSIRNTNKGGFVITEDVMLNLTPENFKEKEYEYLKTSQFFCKPDNWDKKEFIRALEKVYEKDYNIRTIVVGYFLNTDEEPYYTLGIRCGNNDFFRYPELLKEALNTRFKKSTYFEFLNLDEDDEVCRALLKQGEVLLSRSNY